jgi:hypothetical protein
MIYILKENQIVGESKYEIIYIDLIPDGDNKQDVLHVLANVDIILEI